MFSINPSMGLGLAAALGCAAASAQQTPPLSPATQASSPAAYRSAFEGYQRFTDEKIQPWKATNDTVGTVGGWRAYAKEAQEPRVGASGATSGAPTPKPADPHAGHHKP